MLSKPTTSVNIPRFACCGTTTIYCTSANSPKTADCKLGSPVSPTIHFRVISDNGISIPDLGRNIFEILKILALVKSCMLLLIDGSII